MPSTPKPPNGKRASPPRAADYTKSFLKDWERLSRAGRHNMRQLKEAMLLLIANDAPLGPEWPDHPLKGKWATHFTLASRVHHACEANSAHRQDDSETVLEMCHAQDQRVQGQTQ
jgi:hypothetical protein